MSKKFLVFSRREVPAEEMIKDDHIVISITEPTSQFPNYGENKARKGLLQVKFIDVDKLVPGHKKSDIITIQKAQEIIDFINKYKYINLILCQCDAGISRSSAVAAALSRIMNNDDSYIFENPRFRPNMLVYRTILNTYYRKYK